jgi:hypothetical protein
MSLVDFDVIIRYLGSHHREHSFKLERTQILILPDEQSIRITLRPDQVAELAEVAKGIREESCERKVTSIKRPIKFWLSP